MAETDKDDLISIIEEDEKGSSIPDILPLMPVRDIVIFTDMLLPLFVGREKSVLAVEEAVSKDGFIFLATQKETGVENPKPDQIYEIGTIGRVLRMLKLPDGRVKALVQGVAKARIIQYTRKKSLYRVRHEVIAQVPVKEMTIEIQALMRNVRENSEKILAFRGEMTGDVSAILESIDDPASWRIWWPPTSDSKSMNPRRYWK